MNEVGGALRAADGPICSTSFLEVVTVIALYADFSINCHSGDLNIPIGKFFS